MIEIRDERGLREFFRRQNAVFFYHASWSQYAVISRMMVEMVEEYIKMDKRDVAFYFGEFEDDQLGLASALVEAGVPLEVTFVGNGSLSFFRRGEHLRTMRSVIGEGTFTVWKHIDDLFGTTNTRKSPE